jgi:hypothetical protein
MYLYVSVFVTCIPCVLLRFGEGVAEQHEYINISSMVNCNFNYSLNFCEIKIYMYIYIYIEFAKIVLNIWVP